MRTMPLVPSGCCVPIIVPGQSGLSPKTAKARRQPLGPLPWAALAATLLVGCASGPRASTRLHNVSPDQRYSAARRTLPSRTELSRGVLAPSQDSRAAPTTLGEVRQTDVSDPSGPEWVRLDTWAANHLHSVPRPVGPLQTTWEMASPAGSFQIIAQSRLARYQGLDLWLGFAPNSNPGGLLVHRLDLEKNIRPLLLQSPPLHPSSGHVVIDPGHGGPNAGTSSVLDRSEEKDYTLDWALRLAPLLRAQGWRVTLTRTNDLELSTAERTQLATAVQADLFLSLHFNSAAPNLTRSGIETYCLTPAGLPSTLVRGSVDDVGSSFPNNHFDAMNLQWAARVHASLLQITGAVDRGIRRARFMSVLRNQQCPAVLVEGGFLSHPQEARLIASPIHRQRLAEALALALRPAIPSSGGTGTPRLISP